MYCGFWTKINAYLCGLSGAKAEMAENISKEKRKKKKRRNRIRIINLNLAANLLGHANKAQAKFFKERCFLFLTQSLFMVLREYFFFT